MNKHLVKSLAVLLLLKVSSGFADELPDVVVYKSPSCTCCTKWAAHLEENGFSVSTINEGNMSKIKKELGIPLAKASCHTAVVGDYLIEGHVPAEDVIELLKTRPNVAGLTVPGMPLGSPGMEAPQSQPYVVYTFDAEGNTEVFAEHGP
jgi:hypothetical protein